MVAHRGSEAVDGCVDRLDRIVGVLAVEVVLQLVVEEVMVFLVSRNLADPSAD